MEILTGEELFKQAEEDEKRLSRIVFVDGDEIVLNVLYPYRIELERANTREKVLSWVAQLLGKNWMTTGILERFIRLTCEYHGLTYRGIA